MAYGDFKDLTRRTGSDEILRDNPFNIAKNLKYDRNNFLIEKASGSGIKNKNISNKELPEELHKPITRKFKKRKVQSIL